LFISVLIFSDILEKKEKTIINQTEPNLVQLRTAIHLQIQSCSNSKSCGDSLIKMNLRRDLEV
jgi:hypothetical protein